VDRDKKPDTHKSETMRSDRVDMHWTSQASISWPPSLHTALLKRP